MGVREVFGRDVLLTGWGHTRFGKLADETLESLIVYVATEAIANAGIEPGQVDEIYLGQFNSGMVPLGFAVLPGPPGLRLTWPTCRPRGWRTPAPPVRPRSSRASSRCWPERRDRAGHRRREDDPRRGRRGGRCPARRRLRAGGHGIDHRFRRALRRGRPALREAPRPGRRHPRPHRRQEPPQRRAQPLRPAPQGPRRGVLPHRLRQEPRRGRAAAPHRLLARLRRRGGRRPLHRAHPAAQPPPRCGSPASATPTTSCPSAQGDPLEFAGTRAAWQRALAMAGVGPRRPRPRRGARLLHHRRAGHVRGHGPGRAARAPGPLEEGWVVKDGRLPVNVSGGLKAKGHPVGATGVSQHVLAAMQLSGTAGDMQLAGARRAAVHNMGGLAVANYVSVLEAV